MPQPQHPLPPPCSLWAPVCICGSVSGLPRTHAVARKRTLPLGFAASFAPNRAVNADSTAFFSSSGLTQRSAGVFFSAVMAAPIPVQPATAGDPTYSATAVERASALTLNPVWLRNGGHAIEGARAAVGLTDSAFAIKLAGIYWERVRFEVLDSHCNITSQSESRVCYELMLTVTHR